MTKRSLPALAAGTFLLFAILDPVIAAGDDDNPFNRGTSDRFSVSLGAFFMNFDTNARVDSDQLPGSGTDIDLENDTGLNNRKDDWRLDGYWRFARKHRLEFGAMSVRRGASRVIDRSIEFGDTVFDVNGQLDTTYDLSLFKLAYKYSFIRGPRADFGFSAGFSTYGVKVGLSGAGSVSGGPSGQITAESESVVAPVPLVGLHTEVHIGGNWYFKASGEYFHVNVDNMTGSLSDLRACFDWYPWKHFGFGAGFNQVRIVYKDISSTTVDFEYQYSGAMAYGTYVF